MGVNLCYSRHVLVLEAPVPEKTPATARPDNDRPVWIGLVVVLASLIALALVGRTLWPGGPL